MQYVLTPVGRSLFQNFLDTHSGASLVRSGIQRLEGQRSSSWDDESYTLDSIRTDRTFLNWLDSAKTDASAELTSIGKINSKTHADHLKVRLIATDTLISRLAAEILQGQHLEKHIEFQFNPHRDVIQDLQVNNAKDFHEGLRNLIRYTDQLIKEAGGRVILNFTGGYKASIPYLTMIAQIYQLPAYYTFKASGALLNIPQMPINIDWELFEEYERQFSELESGVENWKAFQATNHQFVTRAAGCIESAGNIALLSPIGELFWRRYLSQFFVYYAPDDIEEQIHQLPEILRILRTKGDYLVNDIKVEKKKNHWVYDDGANQNRIYFFCERSRIYIYRAFQVHAASDDFIPTPFTSDEKQQIIRRSAKRKIKRDTE